MRIRHYGESGPLVIAIHGGPGAPGSVAPVARELADQFRVLEPFQRHAGDAPLTVATHVADLHELVTAQDQAPAIVGWSWGSMLALAYAAQWPESVARRVVINCGTFDEASRAVFQHAVAEHPNAYFYDPITTNTEERELDERGHEEAWGDMLRLQRDGIYPAAFAAIKAPVLMIHGSEDPHPGPMIRDCLRRYIAHLEYRELPRCSHYPWLERHACVPLFEAQNIFLGQGSRRAAN